MPKKLEVQTDFSAGELSPRLYGRTQVERYQKAVKTATNCTVLPQGPLRRRTGSQFVKEVKDSTNAAKLIPFQFSQNDALILEFGDSYIRFYKDKAILVDSTDFTNGTFDSDISSWTDISSGTGSIAHATDKMNLVGGGGGNEARAEQILTLGTGTYQISAVVGTGDITVKVGTTSGGTEIGSDTLSVGTDTYSFSPSARGDIYITFENANNDTRTVDTITLTNTDQYEIDTPWDETEIANLQYAQFGATMYFAHPDYAPRTLERISASNWRLETLSLSPEPTIELGFEPDATLTPAATTGTSINFTASAAVFEEADVGREIINLNGPGRAAIRTYTSTTVMVADIVEDFPSTDAIASGDWKLDLSPRAKIGSVTGANISTNAGAVVSLETVDITNPAADIDSFRSEDVGKYVLFNNGVCKIVSVTNAREIVVVIMTSLDDQDQTANWTLEEPAWSETRGYPRTVGFYEQRLVFGGTAAQPQTIWMSESGIFDGFGSGANDDNAVIVDLSSQTVNQIEWISGNRDLTVGTSGAEFTLEGGGQAITPDNIRARPRTHFGSNQQQVVQVRNETLFIQKSERKVNTFFFNFDVDSYDVQDITFLAEHITEGGLKEIAYAQEPNTNIYAVLDNGDMAVGTYLRSERVIGWTKFTTDGFYENVATISINEEDQVWAVVNRTINGATKRYVEVFDSGDGTDAIDGFSDSFLTYSDPKTITGITAANPGVVTAAAHGFSNGNQVKLINVGGMTEANGNTYLVANQTTNTFELESTNKISVLSSTYKWTASGSGTNEYYLELAAGGDPSVNSGIINVYQADTALTEGTAGSLSAGEWDYADNDTLGYSTIYVRVSGGTPDPDDLGNGVIEYSIGVDTSGFTAYTSGGEAHKLVTTISNLTHLEGETVQVKVDGAAHDDKTVSSGSITLDSSAYDVVVGLPYTTTITTLSKEVDMGTGSMQGQRARYVRPILRVYKSTKPLVDGEFLPTRVPEDEMDEAVPLTSGDLYYGLLNWKDENSMTISVSTPFPLLLLGVFGTIEGGSK